MITIYRISFAISAAFVVVTIHQLISPDREQEEEEIEEEVVATSDLQTAPDNHN